MKETNEEGSREIYTSIFSILSVGLNGFFIFLSPSPTLNKEGGGERDGEPDEKSYNGGSASPVKPDAINVSAFCTNPHDGQR